MARRVPLIANLTATLPPHRPWATWEPHVRRTARRLRAETDRDPDLVEVDFSRFTPEKYHFSHATIVGGVEPDPNLGYIIAPHGKWVNDNGNAWWNQVLLESYPSFILGENYQEHIQMPILSKGKILDAVAWVVREHFSGQKETIPTVFIDILVATDKRHEDLIRDIQDRSINAMSMGTEITHFQCSRCLEIFRDGEDEECAHIRDHVGGWFRGRDGQKYRTAEMCGAPGKIGSCCFNEASWVRVPAFEAASLHMEVPRGTRPVGNPLKARVPRARYRDALKSLR